MKKILLPLLISILPTSSFANTGDLVLAGEKWIAKFDKYICAAFTPAVARPQAFESLNVVFEQITTDMTLDNGLIKATFEEEGKACRYNAILFADNAASTSRLVESKAYAPADGSECAAGKALLDAAFAANDYLYYGHPHNLAFMVPGVGAQALCGDTAQVVGVNFVVKGRIRPAQSSL